MIRKQMEKKLRESRNIRILLFTLILISEGFALINGNFLSTYNMVSIGQSTSPYAILSMGAIFPIALGCTDLSSGAVCIASATVAGKLYALGMPLPAVIPVMLLFGTLIGMMNGTLIARLKLPPFIVTLGTMMFIRGISALFANQPNILFPTNTWYNRVFSAYNGMPVGFAWVIVIGLLVGWFFGHTRNGRHILAVGSNEKAAMIAGLDTQRLKILAFSLSGLMAGVAAIFWSASFATVKVATGNGMELDAIAGAYIGGSAAVGGSVSVSGAMIGALLLVVIRNGLNFVLAKLRITLNSTYVTYAITGLIVVLAVFLDKSKEERAGTRFQEKEGNFRKFGLPAIAFVLAVCMISGNTKRFVQQEKQDNRTIAILMKSENSAFWNSVKLGAEKAAEEQHYHLLIRGPEAEDSSYLPIQRELLSIMLSENPAGVAVSTIADGFTDLLEEAYDRGVRVIEYDSGLYAGDVSTIEASEKNPLSGFVQGDNYQNAALLAESVYASLRNRIALSDHFDVGIIQHENSLTAERRSMGFQDRFLELTESDPDTAGKCTVLVEVKPSEANNAYREALEALYEKGVSAFFMTNENATNQVYDAIFAAGDKYDGLIFTAYDAGTKALQWLQSDSKAVFLCGVSQDPYHLGYLTADVLLRVIKGEEPENVTVVPGVVYHRENCQELMEQNILN